MVYFLIGIVSRALLVVQIAIIARALFSWIDPMGRTAVGAFLFRVTNPILMPIRRLMPSTGFIDFSPMVALLAIVLLRSLLLRIA